MNTSVKNASYTNTSAARGTWNVSAVASNENGTAMQTWIWTVLQAIIPIPSPAPTQCPTPSPSPIITPTPKPSPKPSYILSSDTTLTPFYIFGWVHYENDAECYNPIVKVANLNTSESWRAESSDNSSFFQLIITNINDSDKLEFNVTDGIVCNSTSHEVKQTEMNNSGIFYFNLTLPVPALTISIELTPDDDPSTPGIQVINPDPNTNKTVTIIANVTDLNGYENITNVTANITGPSKVEDSPVSLNFVSNVSAATAIYRGIFNMSNYSEGKYEVEVRATDAEGTGICSKKFTYLPMLSPAAPRIVSYAPQSPVSNFEGATRTFNISIDQLVNVSWLLNGTEVQINTNVKNASYTNTSAVTGTWNVSAIASNENGTSMRTWIWTVSQQVAPTPTPSPTPSPSPCPSPTPAPTPPSTNFTTPSPPFYIFGSVHYKNGAECYDPTVSIINLNTGKGWQAETSDSSSFFQLLANNINESDLLIFNVTDGTRFNTTNYTITRADINNRGIFGINLTLGAPPQTDLAVTNLWLDPETPVFGDLVNVTARIKNVGNETNSTAVFYDEKNLSIFKFYWNVSNFPNHGNDTITQSDALKIRVHFVDMGIQGEGYIKIYNTSDALIHNFTTTNSWNRTNFWTDWSEGEEIKIESYATNHLYFMIDKYEAVFASEPVTLSCGQSKNFTANWNASAWLNEEDIVSGNHTIRVEVAPVVNESNTENNIKSKEITVSHPVSFNIDLELTNISVDKTPLLDGDIVNITATVMNKGFEDATSFSVIFIDGPGEGNTSGVVFNKSIVPALDAGKSTTISTTWDATFGNHTITAVADPDNEVGEFNESNNQNSTIISVTKSRDFAISDVSLSYTDSNESCDPNNLFSSEKVAINATLGIINLANRGGKLDVGLYLDNALLNTTSVGFDAGNGTENVIFVWEVNTAGNHTLSVFADHNRTITEFNETNNNKSVAITVHKGNDFAVTNITFKPQNPVIGDIVKINATIANFGNKTGFTSVEFYDNKSIEISRTEDDYLLGPGSSINDTLTLANALKIRVHFSRIEYPLAITIYDKNDFEVPIMDNGWTDWASDDTIRIKSYWPGKFTVDRCEALLANESFSLDAGNRTNRSAVLNLSMQEMGWALNGTHNITVIVDPYDDIDEPEEENNINTTRITVTPSLDFAVTNISFEPREPLLGDIVRINATVKNFRVRNGTTFVEIFYDNRTVIEKKPDNDTTIISLPPGVLGARLHFEFIHLGSSGYVDIYKNDTKVERIQESRNDYWTDCIYCDYSDVIRIESHNANFKIDRYEALILNKRVTLNASEPPKVVTALWNATALYGGAAHHNITVRIDPHDVFTERNETNNTLIMPIFVNGTDLAVTNIKIPCGPEPKFCYREQYVNITATIANLGAIDAHNFTVFFRDGMSKSYYEVNTSGVIFNKTPISVLHSGENTTINVTWTPAESGIHTIAVNIPFDIRDNNETNNELYTIHRVAEPEWDFSVENVSVYPREVREGEPVLINATIGNHGHKSGNVSVGFFVNRTDFAGSKGERFVRIGTVDDVPVPVNKTINITFNWTANVHGGEHLVVAVADPDEEIPEIEEVRKLGDSIIFRGNDSVTGNNVKKSSLHVIGPDLAITNLTLDPAAPKSGDIVNISVEIENKGSTPANSTVWFYMQSDESIYGRSAGSIHNRGELWRWSSVLLPEDTRMRFHFGSQHPFGGFYRGIVIGGGGEVKAFVKDSEGQRHTVYFYVGSEEAGDKSTEVKMPKIDSNTPGYECVECWGDVCYYKRWDDIWTEWTKGTAVEINARAGTSSSATLSMDKYQVLLGSQAVKLNAGESKVYNITWNTTFPLQPGKNYTILAIVENRTLSNETYLGGTDLAVTNISLKPSIWDGDLVWLNATITNFGYLNATDFEVSFYEIYEPRLKDWVCQAHRKEINTTRVKGLSAGNSTIVSVPWNASIRDIICKCRLCPSCKWHDKTFKGVDDYKINVAIDLLENREQARVANNSLTTDVHVNRSRDFNVTNLSFFVNGTARNPHELELYDIVTTNATIDYTNLANQPGMVNLSFYLDEVKPEHEIGSTTVRFDPDNGTGYANITWTADNLYGDVYIPGDHNLTVRVDPEQEIYEINDFDTEFPNNDFTWQIHVKAPELVFEKFNITPEPETLVKGDNAIINVTIANRGRLNTTRDFNLTIYEWAERHIDNVASNESYSGFPRIEIERANATAMRLYLDLEKEEPLLDPEIETVVRGGEVCIKDGKGEVVRRYNHSFHGWTPWIMVNKTVVETIKRMTINRYLFCWDNVPGSENKSLLRFLTEDLGLEWAENATINKTDDSRTIQIYAGNNSANLTLDVKNETVIFEINGTMVEDISLIVKGENKIYKPETRDIDIDTKVSKVYYFTQTHIIYTNTTTRNFTINETANITVEWTVPTGGEQFIVAKIDPEDVIMEYNEANNTFKQHVPVQAADLEVTNLSLTWLNGTKVRENDIVRDNDTVRISANVTNVGIEEARDFSVYFLVDDIPIKNETISGLASGSSILVNANWTAEVGKHVIKVEADYDDKINETNETNNIEALVRYVCGAEVSGNTSWETLGLHGLNGTILFEPTQPYDEDEVNITAVINNYGYVNATGFNVLLFYDYDPPSSRGGWLNRSYPGANWTYLRIIDNARKTKVEEYDPMDAGDVKVYDASGNAVLNESNFNDTCNWTHVMEGKSCWIPVRGDTVNVYISRGGNENFSVSLYPIYQNGTSMLYEGINVPVNRSKILTPPMTRNVSVGNFTVMAVIDPENNVPEDEDNKTDNIISRIMRVLPTIDFTVLNVTNVTAEKSNLSDLDTADITAEVANIGYRNGTANVSITDYETENRTYRYHLDKSLNWSYLPTPPDTDLLKSGSGYDDVMVIRRPGVDAINVHLSNIWIYKPDSNDNRYGSLAVCNESGVKIWNETANPKTKTIYIRHKDIRVSGETVYIYSVHASFSFDGYTTEKKWLEERDVPLNATKTWNESKNFTVKNWLATTGNHRINVTVWNNTTKEINETNNTFILPLEVNASRDPTVVNITFDPEHPEDGDNVTITATVKNSDNSTKNATFMVDLWLTVTRNSSIAPIPDAEWAIQHKENRTSYIIHLGRENVTLTPGNETTVNATWHNMNLSGDPLYVVTAIVDPLDEIDEINESQSDNELNEYLWMNYPDFTITKFNQPTRKEKNASVTIKNAGMKNASNVTVMFKLAKFSTYGLPLAEGGFGYPSLSHPGAFDLQLHFARLNATSGCLWLKKNLGDEDNVEEYCGEELYDVWTPWIDSDTVYIVYAGADFWIDEYKWGDVEYKTIDRLNASESKDVFLPERWSKYERPMMLDVWVDPEIDTADNKIGDFEEQNEGNNHRSGVIYADLVLRSVGTVFSEDGDLSGINATIWSNNTLEDGIAFPVCNFSVALKDRDTGSTLLTKRIGENGTIYGGEEREVIFNVSHLNSSELMLTPNRTYHFNVVVDSEDKPPYRAPGEIWEYDETNNEKPIDIGPDIVVGEIKVVPDPDEPFSCNFTIDVNITNEGNFRATNFTAEIFIEDINDSEKNETLPRIKVKCLPPRGPEANKTLKFPWSQNENEDFRRQRVYDATVTADPDDDVKELDETNNENGVRMGAEIEVKLIAKPPQFGGTIYPYAPVKDYNDNCTIKAINNTGNICTGPFKAKLTVVDTKTNSKVYDPPVETIAKLAPGEVYPFIWPLPLPSPPEERTYNITVEADLPSPTKEKGDTVELRDEINNNRGWANVTIYNYTDYGGKNLEFYTSGSVYGGFAYTIGNSNYVGGNEEKYYEVEFDDVYPNSATPRFARLYLYWVWSYECKDYEYRCCRPSPPQDPISKPAPIEVDVKFNGPPLGAPYEGGYYESPHASDHDVAWGAYAYDLPANYVKSDNNVVNITKISPYCNYTDEMGNNHTKYTFAIYGVGLLVAYNDSKGVLTNYWINEGADVLYGDANALHETDLVTTAVFNGTVEDLSLANATLWTVVPGGGSEDETELRLNGKSIGKNVYNGSGATGIGIDNRYVTDNLSTYNTAEIQLFPGGGSMMPTNAMLVVTYPPDLEPEVPTTLNANAGASYDIPITIHNWGRSKAKNFNVNVTIVTIDGNVINKTIPIPEIKGAGQEGDTVIINIPQKAPAVERIITFNLKVDVDPVDAGHPEGHVKELINSYRNGEENNIWNDTVMVIVNPPPGWGPGPGGGGGTGGGWGTGTGTGTGSGSGTAKSVAGGTGQGGGESGGKTITGRLMKGVVVPGGEETGGGGKGGFSLLAWLIRLALLAAVGSLVCAGYLMERRRQNNKLSLQKRV